MAKWIGIWVSVVGLLAGCSQPDRDNPSDPGRGNGAGVQIQLVAKLPEDAPTEKLLQLAEFFYSVKGDSATEPITGTMSLVGRQAVGRITNLPVGQARVFQVDAFDNQRIRAYTAIDTLDISRNGPDQVELDLVRLFGEVELTADLPPEIQAIQIEIAGDIDTLYFDFSGSGQILQRLEGIPTGSSIALLVKGRDEAGQVLLTHILKVDVRDDLLARIRLALDVGSLEIIARFPDYIPFASIDRFSDQAATFLRRSQQPDLPAADTAIDFDALFLHQGLGPDGEVVHFYNLDTRPVFPAPIYVLVDNRGIPIPGQLPIFDLLPGNEGHNDLWQVHQVLVSGAYLANQISSMEGILALSADPIPTQQIIHCVMVPLGSRAQHRLALEDDTGIQFGWYRDKIVPYFLFETPLNTTTITLDENGINTPQMFAFLAVDSELSGGFATDAQTGFTHNVFARLPGAEGYSPLWVVQFFKLAAFARVEGLASALDQAKNEENVLDLEQLLHINAPIVKVE